MCGNGVRCFTRFILSLKIFMESKGMSYKVNICGNFVLLKMVMMLLFRSIFHLEKYGDKLKA